MRWHRGRFVLAVLVAGAVILAAPFVGDIRNQLKAAFPGRYGLLINLSVAAMLAAAVISAAARIRERRALRYLAIGIALTIAATYAFVFAKGSADTRAVERFHFVEYGLVTFLFYRAWRPRDDVSVLALSALAALTVGTIDEWFQWFIPGRYGELADIWLNGFAIACGLLLSAAIDPVTARRGSFAGIGVALAVALTALAIFIDVVHLGHMVDDPEAGSFRSRFTSDELIAAARERAAIWRTAPPIATPARLSREDQYLTEGIWHVQRRNEQWTAGQMTASWSENRILETYFAPVLDAPSYLAPAGNRWPALQRGDAARRASVALDSGASRSTYVSDAERYPIFVWPRAAFWIVAAVSIGLAVLAAGLLPRLERPLLH